MIGFYDLSDDYLQNFVEQIESVSVAAAKQAMARRIQPDRMVTVIVGDIATDQDKKAETLQE
jgi:zinc protease